MNRRFVLRAITPPLLALLAARTLRAQEPRPTEGVRGDTVPALVLTHRFVGATPDTAYVLLEPRTVYRLELTARHAEALVQRTRPSTSDGTLMPIEPDSTAGPRRFALRVSTRQQYRVRVFGLMQGDTALVRIVADRRATEEMARARAEARPRAWELGLIVDGGLYSPFLLTRSTLPANGLDLEGGLLIASGQSPFALVLGVGAQPRYVSDQNLLWLFAEGRARLVRRGLVDLAVSLRLAQGHATGPSNIGYDPVMLAPGVLLAYRLTGGASGRGVALTGAYQYGRLSDVQVQGQGMHRASVGVSWLP